MYFHINDRKSVFGLVESPLINVRNINDGTTLQKQPITTVMNAPDKWTRATDLENIQIRKKRRVWSTTLTCCRRRLIHLKVDVRRYLDIEAAHTEDSEEEESGDEDERTLTRPDFFP